jgi:hypothetical protein
MGVDVALGTQVREQRVELAIERHYRRENPLDAVRVRPLRHARRRGGTKSEKQGALHRADGEALGDTLRSASSSILGLPRTAGVR